MLLKLYLYETDDDLAPLDLLRHQSDIHVGAFTLGERIQKLMGEHPRIISKPRPVELADAYPAEKFSPGVFMPANLLLKEKIPMEGPEEVGWTGNVPAPAGSSGVSDGHVVFMRLSAERAAKFDPRNLEAAAAGLPRRVIAGEKAIFIRRPWDVVRNLNVVLTDDCGSGMDYDPDEFPSVVIDQSDGPVWIEPSAVIEPFAYIKGPAYIGRDAVIKAHAAIRGSFIGAHSRVGGEVSASTIFPYVNKQHLGFIGHSVVASWVNIGAGTTGSNLKNTYGEIRIAQAGGDTQGAATMGRDIPASRLPQNTGMHYLGQIIGDHTKIGIQAVMDTGSIYGICCSLFAGAGWTGSSGALPKFVSNFTFGNERADIDAVINTAKIVMARRDKVLMPLMEKLIRAYAIAYPASPQTHE